MVLSYQRQKLFMQGLKWEAIFQNSYLPHPYLGLFCVLQSVYFNNFVFSSIETAFNLNFVVKIELSSLSFRLLSYLCSFSS